MDVRVVGAGLGRTGTHSLQLALTQLLDRPCHHMSEVLGNETQMALWTAAADGTPDWPAIFAGYAATVDWPSVAFWRELVDVYPDAVVLLSHRADADAWWTSASRTIFAVFEGTSELPPPAREWFQTIARLMARNGVDPNDEAVSKAAYEEHLASVRAVVPATRLVEWQPGDGWEPLCDALGVPVPDEPFPHVNTTADFRAMAGLDG